jgi:hypothetical protein
LIEHYFAPVASLSAPLDDLCTQNRDLG